MKIGNHEDYDSCLESGVAEFRRLYEQHHLKAIQRMREHYFSIGYVAGYSERCVEQSEIILRDRDGK